MQQLRAACAALVALLCAVPAAAVLIASGDGNGNTTPPTDDPGYAHVGTVNGLTGVYLGNGWVLTANHVGVGDTTLNGVVYRAVPASAVHFQTSPGVPADLLLFRLASDPGLTPLVLSGPVAANASLVMIGRGVTRGAATSWMGINGFLWGGNSVMRWGTNRVTDRNVSITVGTATTITFDTTFDSGLPTPDECNATVGDSGGAVFVKSSGVWKLAGIMIAIAPYEGQPAGTSLYGNLTFAADLSVYAALIAAASAVPACSDGIDDDGDGLVDLADPGCLDANDAFETNALTACDDGFDNDGDGKVDWTQDPGCASAQSLIENPACNDGIDNDGDGLIDFDGGGAGGVKDPQCTVPSRNKETPGCGIGFELVLLAPLLARLRRLRGAL